MQEPITILVGYDAKPPADRALDRAIKEALDRDGQLVVAAVAEMPLSPEGPRFFGTLDDSRPTPMPVTPPPELEQILETARERIEAAGASADYVWSAGDPVTELVAVARERQASIVVLGSRPHRALGGLFGADVVKGVERELEATTTVIVE